jgi:hypothetical protein
LCAAAVVLHTPAAAMTAATITAGTRIVVLLSRIIYIESIIIESIRGYREHQRVPPKAGSIRACSGE